MRLYHIAILGASIGLITAPAFPQGTNRANTPTTSGQSNGTAMSGQSGNAEQGESTAQQQLTQSLQKAGFTNIRVEPQVFVVHAMNAQGNPVLMRIAPDSMQAITALRTGNRNGGNGANGSGQQQAGRGNGGGNGANADSQ